MLDFDARVDEVNLKTNVTLGHLTTDEQNEVLEHLRSLPDVIEVGCYHYVEVLVLTHSIEEEDLLREIREARVMLAKAFSQFNLPKQP